MASKISKIYGLRYVARLWEEDWQLGLLWESESSNDVLEPFQDDGRPLASRPNANNPDDRPDEIITKQGAAREAMRNQNDNWVTVPDLDADWEMFANIGKATFSWISHCLSGKRIRYNHYRKFRLENHLGIQTLKVTVKQTPMYTNRFREILPASLKVRARAKKALLADVVVICSKSSPYRLMNVEDFQFIENYIAESILIHRIRWNDSVLSTASFAR